MENQKTRSISSSLQNLHIHKSNSTSISKNTPISFISPAFEASVLPLKRTKPPSLISLCISVIGKHLEDIIPELGEIAFSFPTDVKMSIAAIARRRKLLDDEVIISLADGSWEVLDISCSKVSDVGLAKVAEMCRSLRVVDISRCSKITPHGISLLVHHCHSLEILRCGGSPRSDYTARRCLGLFKPELNSVEGDSWEELDTSEITRGGQSLQWLVWPNIDQNISETFSSECPRVKVNPNPSPFSYNGVLVPKEALPNIVLDDPVVADIDPGTWAIVGPSTRIVSPVSTRATFDPSIRTASPVSNPSELSVAEKFRLAFVERDTRLAPKRAKNARQHQRRAEREWMTTSSEAKALAHTSQVSKFLRNRN